MACQPRKTEANREKERESQDEPIVNKSNAHGARGETSRGFVRSRVGHKIARETSVRVKARVSYFNRTAAAFVAVDNRF